MLLTKKRIGCKELRFFAKGKLVLAYALIKVGGAWNWHYKTFSDPTEVIVKSMINDDLSNWDLKVPPHSDRPKNKRLT